MASLLPNKPWVEGRQLLGLAGGVLLGIGLRVPVFRLRGEPHALLERGPNGEWPVAGMVILGLVLVAFICVVQRCYVGYAGVAFLAYVLLELALIEQAEFIRSTLPPLHVAGRPHLFWSSLPVDTPFAQAGLLIPWAGLFLLLLGTIVDLVHEARRPDRTAIRISLGLPPHLLESLP
jgi:hypothetical protein